MEKTVLINIPSLIYLGVIGAMGTVGNSLILIVYSRKKKKTATTIFIQFLAVVDLVTDVVIIPATVYIRLFYGDFGVAYLCKTYVFANITMTVVPMLAILAIAVTRYRKICKTFGWQVSPYQAKVTCGVIVVVASLVVSPYIIARSMRQPSSTNGTVCYLDDTHVPDDTTVPDIWSIVTHALILLVFLLCSLSLTILYWRIGMTAWRPRFVHLAWSLSKRKSTENGRNLSNLGFEEDTVTRQQPTTSGSDNNAVDTEDSTETYETPNNACSNNSTLDADARLNVEENSNFMPNFKAYVSKENEARLKASRRKRPFCGRITRMLFFISAVYVLSYLTSITLSVVRVAIPGVILSLNSGPQAVYSLFLLSYLVNSGVNPIFYSFYDRNFKKESKKMFKLITRRKNGCL